jgi:hypothetical protein
MKQKILITIRQTKTYLWFFNQAHREFATFTVVKHIGAMSAIINTPSKKRYQG